MIVEDLYNEFCQATGAQGTERTAFLAGMCAAAQLVGSDEVFHSALDLLGKATEDAARDLNKVMEKLGYTEDVPGKWTERG